MIKRLFDLLIVLLASPLILPIVVLAAACVWLQDFRSPIYSSIRVGLNGRAFRIFKLRTMVVGADKNGVDTTVLGDPRVTKLGSLLRKWKIDELPQLLNVFLGQMSIVGPRPNVHREVRHYTVTETALLTVKPGITDLASIAFSNLAEALANSEDPNAEYKNLVRPWKSRLGILYLQKASLWIDFWIVILTLIVIVRRKWAMRGLGRLLRGMGAEEDLVSIATSRVSIRSLVQSNTGDN